MGINGALVDTAHFEWTGATGPRVNGKTPYATQTSATIKCRASTPTPQELRTDAIQFEQYSRDITVLMALKTTTGADPAPSAKKRFVIETGPFAGTYVIQGDPKPIRAKSKMIAWQLACRAYEGKADAS